MHVFIQIKLIVRVYTTKISLTY